jgi:hypothetical protein
VKVNAIQESTTLDTLTVDELFSKLRNPSAPTMALVFGKASSSSLTNTTKPFFALSSLVTVTEEQMESLRDDELALVISRFSQFHNNRLNHQRGGGPKEGCFGCSDPNHYIANCTKKNKNDSGKYNSDKHSYDKYNSGKHKDNHEAKYRKSGFNKEYIKKKYIKLKKVDKHAFLASISDHDDLDDNYVSSSDDESEKKRLNGLFFFANAKHGGFCTMALDDDGRHGEDEVCGDNSSSEVSPTLDSVTTELDTLNDMLVSQDKLLKHAARERKEYKEKWKVALRDLEFARSTVHVSKEIECDACAVHMSNFSTLQTKYASFDG